ncbi:alpha/beta hydrolase [Paenibacillus qinlingensis]|uniref:Pimeloyl-ACP methyl ester carboxylesterase n=1 Tax=Paenibacillus qinlingensis TaxID=1837343 RepID=A0ABU1NP56_9BACL|nr:alpha/beta hydrolase [Paenibacillus qinlingensis]MDR6549154.1 pimeloyl-ACP methyl ester carboxylesterase [Paenibacillus qinlingensis]
MEFRKKGFLMITVFFACLSVVGVASYLISYKVIMWSKKLDQWKLGDLEFLKKYAFEIQIFAISSIILLILSTIIFIKMNQKQGRKLKIVVTLTFSILVGTYLCLCLFIYHNLNGMIHINHLVYQPKKLDQASSDQISLLYSHAEEIKINTTDNIQLQGWLLRNTDNDKQTPLIIYFGGSSEEVSDMLSIAEILDGWSIALINYRSFGRSEGEPSEQNLYLDANAIYDYFSKRSDIDKTKIVSMGYSRGTGVAVNLSKERPTSGTILVSPYDNYAKLLGTNLSNTLQLHHMFPLSLFIEETFNSIKKAPSIHTPLLCLAGDLDRNIPIAYSKKLVDKWGGEKIMKTIYRGDHSLLFSSGEAWKEIKSFLKTISL